ncbi:MAG TPA: NAD(+) synthase, partial [Planctomycetota bacterium]|nr:NAD(+) synthase [Planctomycetota bacterium]
LTRRGYSPAKVAYLACEAFTKGPDPAYTEAQVFDWLGVFLERFFGSSQFKRSAMPNGPKVGSGGSLSPRGDWRAPSDAGARTWLDALAEARTWAQPEDGDCQPES